MKIFTRILALFEKKIKILPNSTSGQFTVSFGSTPVQRGVLEIYSVGGEMQYTSILYNTTNKIIDLSDYPAGTYLVKIVIDGKNYNMKILKE